MINRKTNQFAVLLFFTALTCAAEDAPFVILSNGVQLTVHTSFGHPTGQQTIHASQIAATGDSFFRIFRDQNGLTVYAYELAVERPSGDEFHVMVKPAGDQFARLVPASDGGKPAPTLSAPRELSNSSTKQPVLFPVFQIPGTGEDVVDSIELHIGGSGTAAPGGLRFSNLRIFVNKALAAPAAAGTVSGTYAMFYLPGHGGYFFSTAPVPGKSFIEAGWIDRDRMQFTIDNETYDGTAGAPILGESERGELWVFHDPSYAPDGNWTKPLDDASALGRAPGFFTAAGSTLGWWVK